MKIYCEKCGSTQFLRHLEDCEAWKVAVEKPTPRTQYRSPVAREAFFPVKGADPKRRPNTLCTSWLKETTNCETNR
jgi:hypothetical protein